MTTMDYFKQLYGLDKRASYILSNFQRQKKDNIAAGKDDVTSTVVEAPAKSKAIPAKELADMLIKRTPTPKPPRIGADTLVNKAKNSPANGTGVEINPWDSPMFGGYAKESSSMTTVSDKGGEESPSFQGILNGTPVGLSGNAALAYSNHENAKKWRAENPYEAGMMRAQQPGDLNPGMAHRFGQAIRGFAMDRNPTLAGTVMDQGPYVGAAVMGSGGVLAGMLGGWLKDKLRGTSGSSKTYGAIGGIGAAALGGIIGHLRRNNEASYKQASFSFGLGSNENFIMEALQNANDISFSEKSTLMRAIQALDYEDQSRLAQAIRAAAGFGIGALIAKFIFGTSGVGSVLGGLLGMGVNATINTLFGGKKEEPFKLNTYGF